MSDNLELQLEQAVNSYFKAPFLEAAYSSAGVDKSSSPGGVLKFFGKVGLTIAAYYVLKHIVKKILTDKDTIKSWSSTLSTQIASKLDVMRRKDAMRQLDPNIPRAVKGYGVVDRVQYAPSSGSQTPYRIIK